MILQERLKFERTISSNKRAAENENEMLRQNNEDLQMQIRALREQFNAIEEDNSRLSEALNHLRLQTDHDLQQAQFRLSLPLPFFASCQGDLFFPGVTGCGVGVQHGEEEAGGRL